MRQLTTTEGRRQRLRTLEESIRQAAEEIQRNGLVIGHALCEIRDEELWEGEYESWNEYLKEMAVQLVGRSFAQAALLMRAAEVDKRIPANLSIVDKTELTPAYLAELGRLAPNVG